MPRSTRRALLALPLVLAVAAASPGAAQPSAPSSAHLQRGLAGPDSGTFPGAQVPLGDRDARGPVLPPVAGAQEAVDALGDGVSVTWTQYGTPRTLLRRGGWLAQGLAGSPEQVARTFLTQNRALLGLSVAEVAALQLVHAAPLAGTDDAHAVLLRQTVAGLPVAEDGQVVVAVRGGSVAGVTSSIVPSAVLGAAPSTSPRVPVLDAVLTALRDAGVTAVGPEDLALLAKPDAAGFRVVRAGDLAQHQRARLRVLPTTDRGARLVWETAVQDVAGGLATAAATYVDAVSGDVLLRRDAVDTAAAGTHAAARAVSLPGAVAPPAAQVAAPSGGTVQGSFQQAACSAPIALDVPPGTRTIALVVAATVPSNDIVLRVYEGTGDDRAAIGAIDTLTSPEAGVVGLDEPAPEGGAYELEVCPFEPDTSVEPLTFAGTYATTEQAITLPPLPSGLLPGAGVQAPPTFLGFSSNPALAQPGTASPDDRERLCFGEPGQESGKDLSGCSFTGAIEGQVPYDVEATSGLPTLATVGNNAVTTNAQASTSLTPGPPLLPVTSPTRDYAPPFTDAWHTSSCDPAQTVGRADVDASIVNLFVGHNRTHDFAYRLGLTEQTGALQVNNYGKGGAEGDPELGNAQNAAATNPVLNVSNEVTVPTTGLGLAGRNNANQITLMDGIPGITNQYLFEPVLGFYGPCVDGGLDASIWLHEYTHAISNRLVAGPDTGLSGLQAGAMGESWSDLVALEFLQAFGYAGQTGEDPFAVGAYATGDPERGIRNYNAARSPLRYGEFGYDAVGPQVHASGEIWTATNIAIRQALVERYRAQFDPTDQALQASCALAETAWDRCPGNRRWVTYLFDGMLLQANGSPTMLDVRDSMLMGVQLRGGADLDTVLDVFASRGMGLDASAVDVDDAQPVPGYASSGRNGTVTFELVDATTGAAVPGEVYVGTYQARSTPVAATTGAEDAPDATAPFVAGTYPLLVRAAGYGLVRDELTVVAGQTSTKTVRLLRNVASAASGATVAGDGGTRLEQVVDDDEGTNGGFDGSADGTPVAGRTITVDLAGEFSRVERLAVSALHRPVDDEVEGDFQGRLLGLRAFDVEASADGGATWTTVYRSPDDFFPADRPRALAPDLQLRTVDLPQPVVADRLRLVVRTSQCTGAPDFNGVQKSALAEALNGASACGYTLDDTTASSGHDAAHGATQNPTENAESFQVLVTELQAFGAPTAAPAGTAAPGPQPPSAAAPTRGRTLPATGSSAAVAALALGAVVAAGVGLRLARRREV